MLVKENEQKPLKYLDLFHNWLGISPKALNFLVGQHKNPDYWKHVYPSKSSFNGWSVNNNLDGLSVTSSMNHDLFEVNSSLEHHGEGKYIVFGKGCPG